jgi:hypothetical protein
MKHIFNFTSSSEDSIQMNENLKNSNITINVENVIDNDAMVQKYNISIIPTLVLMEDGSASNTPPLVGLKSIAEIEEWANG